MIPQFRGGLLRREHNRRVGVGTHPAEILRLQRSSGSGHVTASTRKNGSVGTAATKSSRSLRTQPKEHDCLRGTPRVAASWTNGSLPTKEKLAMKKLHVLFGAIAFTLIAHVAPVNAAPSGLSGLSNGKSVKSAEQVHWRPYRHHHRRYYRRGPGISLYIGPGRRHHHHRHYRRW